jgi:3-oxoacyl-[acyl-carrier-protein] synthase III
MAASTFISGISQQLGQVAELSELTDIGISEDIIAELRLRGFERFLRETNDPPGVWSTCASAAIHQARIKPDVIDFVLMAVSSHLLEAALQTVQLAGLGRCRLLGISLQDCCTGIAAISVASELACRENESRRILAIIPCIRSDSTRLGRNHDVLFSDGTIAFVVSNTEGDFEILASECSTDPSLIDLKRNTSQKPAYLLAGLDNLQTTAERTLRNAGVQSSSLKAVFCTNANSVFQDAIGMATSTREIIYKDTFLRFGHVLACDELLGLKDYMEEQRISDGDLFLLLSWAPYTTAACVLRRCLRNNAK